MKVRPKPSEGPGFTSLNFAAVINRENGIRPCCIAPHVCLTASFFFIFYREVNGKIKHDPNPSRKERPQKRGGGGGGGRYEPYGNVHKRYRVFVSNIPYDVKWQALKDLMKEKGKAPQNKRDRQFPTRRSLWCDRLQF